MGDIDFLSISFWFVIPVGGLLGGMAAASGYYVAARATQTMPSRMLLLSMIAMGALTWVLSKWVPYTMLMTGDGTRAADHMPFWDYV
jgi:ABC-type Fe3+-siderophore transport system permease subunit